MAEHPKGLIELCGVRIERRGPVILVDSADHHADPFDLVIVSLQAGETTAAMVVIGSGQIVRNAADAAPGGRIVRSALPEEIGVLQVREDLAELREAGLPSRGSEWLVPPGGEPSAFAHPTSDAAQGSVRSFIDRLFGAR